METSKKDRAAAWVTEAIDAGLEPQVIIQSDGTVTIYTHLIGSRTMSPPDDLGRDIEQCLMEKGRVMDAVAP